MVYIQINISNELNRELNIYRAKKDLCNKEMAIINILNEKLVQDEE